MIKKRVKLVFGPEQAGDPATYILVKNFNLKFSILQARIADGGGRLVLEIEGEEDAIEAGLKHLRSRGINAEEVHSFVAMNDEKCMDCGLCVSICPAGAIDVDRETWCVILDPDACIGCGACYEACPLKAMEPRI